MSVLVGLGPLLDPAALWGIAQQLWAARERLSLRTGANIPSASQLLVALRMYIGDQDRRRAAALSGAPLSLRDAQVAADAASTPRRALRAPPEPALSPPHAHNGEPSANFPLSAATDLALLEEVGVPFDELGRFLMLAEAAYCDNQDDLMRRLQTAGSDSTLLEARWYSSKYHPAYYIAYDTPLDAIVLSVRGSKETADFITNLMVDTAPFDSGYGHSGMVQSAQNLAAVVSRNLYSYIDAYKPKNGVVIIGHSLGAAVGTLITIMLRTDTLDYHVNFAQEPPRRVVSRRSSTSVTAEMEGYARSRDASLNGSSVPRRRVQSSPAVAPTPGAFSSARQNQPSSAAKQLASNARCFAFAPPPCLSPDVARKARDLGVTAFVLGLDMVPRLSASSLDRLLVAVSRYDWRAEVTGSVEDWLRPFMTQALGAAGGAAAAATIASVGPNLLGPLIGAIQRGAQQALASDFSQSAGPRSGVARNGMHPMQKLLLGAVAAGGGFLLHQFYNQENATPQESTRMQRTSYARTVEEREYPFAARFGMTPAQVEEALIPNQPQPLHVVGRILHIDRPFTPADQYRDDPSLPTASIVERGPDFFLDVEASCWMLHDHHPPTIAIALTTLHDRTSLGEYMWAQGDDAAIRGASRVLETS